ncbi:MAG: hypothetical protein KKD77_20880 [Gammaproteobacteria bacterium]|nr:hypothetical protein [Gammaproteobacteria bacterium]
MSVHHLSIFTIAGSATLKSSDSWENLMGELDSLKRIIFIGFVILVPFIVLWIYLRSVPKCAEKAVLQWLSEI